MAVSLNDIKTKIASTKNTSQITNAMQMVSAAKLGRSEEAARNFQVYAQKVRKLVTDILHGDGAAGSTNPMLISRPVKKTGYIVITSDRGLVGGYNSSILKAVRRNTTQMVMTLKSSVSVVWELTSLKLVEFSQSMNYVALQVNQALMRFIRLSLKRLKCIKMNFSMSFMFAITTM